MARGQGSNLRSEVVFRVPAFYPRSVWLDTQLPAMTKEQCWPGSYGGRQTSNMPSSIHCCYCGIKIELGYLGGRTVREFQLSGFHFCKLAMDMSQNPSRDTYFPFLQQKAYSQTNKQAYKMNIHLIANFRTVSRIFFVKAKILYEQILQKQRVSKILFLKKVYLYSSLRYICEVVSRRASFMASAGITALLKKMDYKDVVIAIDGSLFR